MKDYTRLLHRLMEEAGTEEAASSGGAPEDTGDAEDVATDTVEPSESDDAEEADSGDADDKTSNEITSYADFDMPDGMEIDAAMLEKFSPAMLEMGLTQEQAQSLATINAEMVQAGNIAQQETYSQQLESWITEAKADKVIGGDNWDESVAIAQSAVDTYGSPELTEVLDDYGVGSNPAMIKFMHQVGLTLKEDSLTNGGPIRTPKDKSDILYPTK
jgi:hypothetical protein